MPDAHSATNWPGKTTASNRCPDGVCAPAATRRSGARGLHQAKGIVMNRIFALFGLAAGVLSAAAPAVAASAIGRALAVEPNVAGVLPDRSTALQRNDRVIEDETIATGERGNAQLQFIDATNLSIGPSSRVTLDKFVFAGKTSAKTFILNAMVGAFRFATGHSAHSAYEIVTPAAIIGVRGTRFNFQIAGQHLSLWVENGMVVVCPLTGRSGCVEARPGQTVSASAGSLPVIVAAGGPPGRPPQGPFGWPAIPIDIGIGLGLPVRGPGGGGLRPPPQRPPIR
jgi:hypothetical protein